MKYHVQEGVFQHSPRPPYESDWVEIPTHQEIEALKPADGSWETGGTAWAQNWIIVSVMNWDFARYVIGTNSGHSDWLSLSLDEPVWQSAQDKEEEFVASLDSEQKEAWDAYAEARRALAGERPVVVISLPEKELRETEAEAQSTDEDDDWEILETLLEPDEEKIARREREMAAAEDRFLQLLGPEQRRIYHEVVHPLLDRRGDPEEEPRFDMSKMQRWIVKRVFEMGWTQERFGLFDRYHGQRQRDAYKPERIGKKYQWIAYHEILARIADNFQFRESYSRHPDRKQYKGTWQLRVRDIDPSCVLKSKPEERATSSAWWSPFTHDDWNVPIDDLEWLKSTSDLPDPHSLIQVVNPRDESRWLTLYGFYRWKQPVSADLDPHTIPRRDIFYFLQGYLVPESDISTVFDWARDQNFFGRWMPEGRRFVDLYLGEFFWSPAYEHHSVPHMGAWGWQTASDHGDQEIPKPILPLSERYLAERGTFDCSIEESYSISIPVENLVDGMDLDWRGAEGCFFDGTGQLTILDPSVCEAGPESLLVRRERLLQFLEEEEYAILWTLLGEKNLIGGSLTGHEWMGRAVISGAYRAKDGDVVGGLVSTFHSPPK